MITSGDVQNLMGAKVLDRDDDKIGSVEQVYLDDNDGHPSWVSVRTGFFGAAETLVPLDAAQLASGELRVPYEKSFVKDAPHIDADQSLSRQEEDELYRYYGLGAGETATHSGTNTGTTSGHVDTGVGTGTDRVDTGNGHDTSGPSTDSAMTRSEEHLEVGTQNVTTGRARLRKYVVTENETVTVPTTHEEVHLEREPITDANVGDALDGPAISEEEHEITLHEERPVVTTEATPVERVRVNKDTVVENETVTGEVRKEKIELDEDGTTGRNL